MLFYVKAGIMNVGEQFFQPIFHLSQMMRGDIPCYFLIMLLLNIALGYFFSMYAGFLNNSKAQTLSVTK
jgi:hypothetical protein